MEPTQQYSGTLTDDLTAVVQRVEHKRKLIEDMAWLGQFVAAHEIGPYFILEYHPNKLDGCRITDEPDTSRVKFSAHIEGKSMSESYHSLDAALAGCIAYRLEGCNHRADRYFIRALESIAEKAVQQ